MKAAVEHVQQEYAFSQRRACGLLMVAVSSVPVSGTKLG